MSDSMAEAADPQRGGRFLNATITDSTPYAPGDLVVGYGSNEGSGGNYVVAWFDYVYR